MTITTRRIIIPQGNDEIAYAITNGPVSWHSADVGNAEYPSLDITVDQNTDEDFDKFYSNVTAVDGLVVYPSGPEPSQADIYEIKAALCGKALSWKLTSIAFYGYGLCFNFHNFGRERLLDEMSHGYNMHCHEQACKDLLNTVGPFSAFGFYGSSNVVNSFIVSEYNKKHKLKRRYKISVCPHNIEVKDAHVLSVEEYSKKNKLPLRSLNFYNGEDKYDLYADIVEYTY